MNYDNLKNYTNELAEMLYEKNTAYGSSHEKTEKFLELLYPNGIKVSDYGNLSYIVRILDKLSRISNQDIDEDAWKDLAGYALLKAFKNSEK